MSDQPVERYEAALKSIAEQADHWADTNRDQWVLDAILDLAKLALNPNWGNERQSDRAGEGEDTQARDSQSR